MEAEFMHYFNAQPPSKQAVYHEQLEMFQDPRIELIAQEQSKKIISHASKGRNHLVPAVVAFYKRMDDALELASSQAAPSAACEAGCAHCCYMNVTATAPEIFTLRIAMLALPAADLQRVLNNAKAAAAQMKDMTYTEMINARLPCAFLHADRCSVYAARPNACRRFHSTDVTACIVDKEGTASPHEPSAYTRELIVAAEGFNSAMALLVSKQSGKLERYSIPQAVVELFNDPEGCKKRYHAGKRVFKTAHANN